MAEWSLYGHDRKERFERSIEPTMLKKTLMEYQSVFGKSFGITELLELEKIHIRRKAMYKLFRQMT